MSETSLGKIKGLLIGINGYLESNSLSYCVNDAKSLRDVLIDSSYGMNESGNLKLMTDNSDSLNKPTRANIINNIKSLSAGVQESDILFFFFAGHGMEVDGNALLLPIDFRQDAGVEAGISIDLLKTELIKSKAHFKVIVLDSCYSGAVRDRAQTGRMTEIFYNSLFPPPNGFAILASCDKDEYSYEWSEQAHGVFTYYLIEGLKGNADENGDGYVDVLELHHWVVPKVQQWAFEHNKIQRPAFKAGFSGILHISKTSAISHAPSTISESLVSAIVLTKDFGEMKLTEYEYGAAEELLESIANSLDKVSADAVLSEFDPSELKILSDPSWSAHERAVEGVVFPTGRIFRRIKVLENRNLTQFWIELHLDYSSSNREVNERIIAKVSDYLNFWSRIRFQVGGLTFDMDKLKEICTKRSYKRLAYSTTLLQLVISVHDWLVQSLRISFTTGDPSEISIEPEVSDYLEKGFYTIVNPRNISDVFGDAIAVSQGRQHAEQRSIYK